MRTSHRYTTCLFVFIFFIFIIVSYHYLNTKYAVEMQGRVQVAQEKVRSLLSDLRLDDNFIPGGIQSGNPTPLKNVLKKALRGEDINVLVIGGSHSAGGKLGLDENSLDGLYFKVFTRWWNNNIGKATKSFIKEIPLAIGGTGSYFFAFCYKTFIAVGQKIDLVLIEISANDMIYGTSKPLEQLTRQILAYPSAPAVLYINLLSGLGVNPNTKRIHNPLCINLETFGQAELARHYGITSFSLREIFCRKEKGEWRVVFKNMTGSDGSHISLKANAQVAMMMIKYVRSVFNEVVNDVTKVPLDTVDQVGGNGSSQLLKFLLIESETLKKPLCWTGKEPNVFKNLHQPNLQIEVINNINFSPCFQVSGQTVNVKLAKDHRTDSHGGWCAWTSLSFLQLRIYVPLISDDSSFHKRSVTVLARHEKGEAAAIWLDSKKNTITIKSDSNYNVDRYYTIATRVDPGYHTITVRTVREGMFMVAAVFVGAPDFQAVPDIADQNSSMWQGSGPNYAEIFKRS
ncbi:hypothetical protein OS493_018216 [Desmophyllum pertusum]|uniref:Uncharacterized protein n=1 Tax=Desmophyllum pertusum TaxID=174260 RepID=A0A9W9YDH4_9CNID|nr:hypothetical protein OS493_018216 [Desmophyllum pertusum]